MNAKGDNNMSFTIDEESLTIKGRRGDTASFTFEFENDLTDYTLDFEIKKGLDGDAIIKKSFSNPTNNTAVVCLTSEDTEKFSVLKNSYGTYYWGLKLRKGIEFSQTLIPEGLGTPPLFLVYSEVVGS